MERDVVLKELRTIIEKSPRNITNQDKIYIKAVASQYGVEINTKTACKSCWIDAALQCWKVVSVDSAAVSKKWVLKSGVDVLWRGVRINAATCTDELAEQWIANGFPKTFFQ